MTLVGSRVPSGSTDGPGSLHAAPVQAYVALACLSIALLASTATSGTAAAQLEPDPAPAAPTIAPDPAPSSPPTGSAPPQQGPSAPYVPPQPPAFPPAEPQSTPDPSSAATQTPDTAAAARRASERRRRQAAGKRSEQKTKATPPAAEPRSLARVGALLPAGESADDSHRVFLLAAGALLALLMASGSLISVASRVTRGQLR